jgi:Spy/CpxP family protein refolding chaperone
MIDNKNMKFKLWSLALVIFLLGGITGAAVHALYRVKVAANASSQPPRLNMIEKMKQDLNLTDEQAQKIKTIVEDSRKEFRRVIKDECPGITDMRAKTGEKIRSVLTPEQQKKYDEMRAKREAKEKEAK